MLIIGESINGTIPKVGQAIQEKNETFLRELAKTQYECGAQMLDVNAGVAGGNEVEDLPWLINLVQKEVPIPLMIDSANPDALKAALAVYKHSELPIMNSISGEEEKWNRLFPVIAEKKGKVVVLCMDDQGIPKAVEARLAIASRLFDRLMKADIPEDCIYFDPLVLAVSVESDAGSVTLETIRGLRSTFRNSHVICGASNVNGTSGKKTDQPDLYCHGHLCRARYPVHRCPGPGAAVDHFCQQAPCQSGQLLHAVSQGLPGQEDSDLTVIPPGECVVLVGP